MALPDENNNDWIRQTIIGTTGVSLTRWGEATEVKRGGVGGGGKSGLRTSKASKYFRYETIWGGKKIRSKISRN